MKEETKINLKNPSTWKRLLFMVLFGIIIGVVRMILWVIIIFQVIVKLVTGSVNERIVKFSSQLSRYIYEILLYLTFNNEERPFPFADWPSADSV